jgi:hypothetical protein
VCGISWTDAPRVAHRHRGVEQRGVEVERLEVAEEHLGELDAMPRAPVALERAALPRPARPADQALAAERRIRETVERVERRRRRTGARRRFDAARFARRVLDPHRARAERARAQREALAVARAHEAHLDLGAALGREQRTLVRDVAQLDRARAGHVIGERRRRELQVRGADEQRAAVETVVVDQPVPWRSTPR